MSETTRTRYLSCADTAKLVRRALKREHPGVKFSVRSSTYSGGASIHIGWTDGPTEKHVDSTVAGFAGARFDGMIDLKYGASSWYCETHDARTAETYGHGAGYDDVHASRCCAAAELVHMGSDYVFTSRSLSPDFSAALVALLKVRTGIDYTIGGVNTYDDDREFGSLCREAIPDPVTGEPVVAIRPVDRCLPLL